ncbi:MAG: hypothetical protein Q9170_003423 [Blastenia crenularia]
MIQSPGFYRISSSSLFTLLLSLPFNHQASAQTIADDNPVTFDSPSSIADDIYGHTSPTPTPINASQTFGENPAATGAQYTTTSNPSSSSDDSQNTDRGILNYYFLLLAFLVIVVGIVYFAYVRRQRQKILLSRQNGQRALARDLERWGGGPWGPGRFRLPRAVRQPRREEGLDERGEAPPPYVPKEPEPAYTGPQVDRLHEIPLQDLGRRDQKPPDYDEGPSSAGGRDSDGTAPVMRHD